MKANLSGLIRPSNPQGLCLAPPREHLSQALYLIDWITKARSIMESVPFDVPFMPNRVCMGSPVPHLWPCLDFSKVCDISDFIFFLAHS